MAKSPPEHLPPLARLNKDLVIAAQTLSSDEARFLVDQYYIIQEDRKRSFNRLRSMDDEPHAVLAWYADNSQLLEKQLARALDAFSTSQYMGVWARSNIGIGPVIAAGLILLLTPRRWLFTAPSLKRASVRCSGAVLARFSDRVM